jgi:hypothetical protein
VSPLGPAPSSGCWLLAVGLGVYCFFAEAITSSMSMGSSIAPVPPLPRVWAYGWSRNACAHRQRLHSGREKVVIDVFGLLGDAACR